MSNPKWMIEQIQIQTKSIKNQISGLPEDIRKNVLDDTIKILTSDSECELVQIIRCKDCED